MLYAPDTAPILIFQTFRDKDISRIIVQLEQEVYCTRDCYTPHMAEVRALEFFGTLLRFHHDHVTLIDRSKRVKDANIVSCLNYLCQHYSEVTLSELAERFHYSPAQLSKLIHRHTGQTFLDFVRTKKVASAANLLRCTDRTIQDISEAVGFSNNSYFYRCFCTAYQMTPLEYRRTHRLPNG